MVNRLICRHRKRDFGEIMKCKTDGCGKNAEKDFDFCIDCLEQIDETHNW